MQQKAWHTMTTDAVYTALTTSADGISDTAATERLTTYGKNILSSGNKETILDRLWKQLKNPLALVLVGAGVVTVLLGEFLDAIVVTAALVVNIVIGLYQEGKAASVFKTLERALEHEAAVLRDGVKRIIPAPEVVPGDILVLSGGNAIVADARIIDTEDLATNEAALTGEWASVHKTVDPIEKSAPVAERTNMVFAGTHIASGSGLAVVVATGSNAQFGTIAESVQDAQQTETPLKKEIARIAQLLLVVIGCALVAIFALGLFRGEPIGEMLLIAIAIAVAAMPEGLPAAVSVTLAIGMERLLRAGGLVKSLLAAETLGSTTIILTDKTGTLTRGEMELKGLYTVQGMAQHTAMPEGDNLQLLTMAILASDGFINGTDEQGNPIAEGRPIEKAIVEAGLATGISQDDLFAHRENRLDFAEFDPNRRFAISLNEHGEKHERVYFSGSPEHLLAASTKVFSHNEAIVLTSELRDQFKKVQHELSSRGMRFTGVGYIDVPNDTIDIPEALKTPGGATDIVFTGLLSFADSIREDVPDAIAEVQGAGVHVIMATGDHAETAKAVAEDVGITANAQPTVGTTLEGLTDDELAELLQTRSVLARVLPEQKKRLAKVLQARGHVVAMTGDGVNDAPALITADIGVAVGSGTDAAKSASDLVLVENSFAVIVQAIKEGRRIMDNLRRIVAYLLSTSLGEVLLFAGALAVGGPLPAAPAQILWANMIGEGLMSVPLALEPAGKGVMQRKPQKRGKNPLMTRKLMYFTTAISIIVGGILFGLYSVLWWLSVPEDEIRTVVFVALSIGSMFYALSFKNLYYPLWRINPFTNISLLLALAGTFALLLAVLYIPTLSTLLSLTSLTIAEVGLLILVGVLNLAAVELAKWLIFKSDRPA